MVVFVVFMLMVVFVLMMSRQTVFDEDGPFGTSLVGILLKSVDHIFVGAINVEMVRVGGCDDREEGVKLQERAVVLIGLDHDIFAIVVDHQIAADVFGDAAKESRTADVSFAKQMRNHGTSGCFAVSAGNGNAFFAFG